MLRKLISLAIPVGAIFGPVVYYTSPEWMSELTASLTPGGSQASPDAAEAPGPGELPPLPLEGGDVNQFWEILRFDLTPQWIADRWPRVTTALADLDLQGFRVPLVTGTAEDDLAGSLTYYYNAERQLQRITFAGTTGDYRRLLHLLATHYGFVNRPTNAPNVILFEVPSQGNPPHSYLWVRPAAVLKATDPLKRFELTLVLERP
ncbi:MAG: hypothetical protein PHO07_18550 [Pirellulales bacterium]|jgi:hypothetical protein|nr:hypothetical protein [Thermoguttaceae bacterium]MDD4789172.1 hypothetical protein [Pirellulales bacterium]MDI9444275.1 hypothetical protein [Planctomycetota bacterium]NLZ00933.1 hypothetical protein [Pirellulaceae bacterium]